MTAPTPSRPPPAHLKRPWYLMAALVASWIYGARLLGSGYEVLAFFRGDRPDVHIWTDGIASGEARDAAVVAGEHWLEVEETARKREMPFGAASLLLGGAMVLLAARSMAGREGSRSALVQVVAVHAGLTIIGFFLLRDVALAQAAFESRVAEGLHPGLFHSFGDAADLRRAEAITPVWSLLTRTAFSSFILVALTRPRARAFFRAAVPGPLGEG